MRNPRNKTERITREDKLLTRKKNVVLESYESSEKDTNGIYPATIVEPHKEVKEENQKKRVERIMAAIKGDKKPAVGVTRADKSRTKSVRKMETNSRQKNANIANKKFRPTGSKKNRDK